MSKQRRYRMIWRTGRMFALVAACAACAASAQEMPRALDRAFAAPPGSAQPRVYWWWLESYLDRGGITRDLEEMKRKGIGGALIFDAGSGARYSTTVEQTPCGPPFMSPAWRSLFQYTLEEADRLGLEISLNMGSGWDCGGPWITPEYAAQRLVWSETTVTGPARLAIALPVPKEVRADLPGFPPYYRDVAVVAIPDTAARAEAAFRVTASSAEDPWTPSNVMDGDLSTVWVSKKVAAGDTTAAGHGEWLQVEYPEPRRVSAMFIAPQEGYGPYQGQLQCGESGGPMKELARFELAKDGRLTLRYPEVQARVYRVLLRADRAKTVVEAIHNINRGEAAAPRVRIAELVLAPGEEIDRAESRMRNWRVKAMHVESREVPCDVPAEKSNEFPQDHCVASASIIDLSGRLDRSGRLDWLVPPGRWSILRFGRTPTGIRVSMHSPGGAGLMLDHLSAEAMDLHFENTAGRLLAEAGALAGKSLKYFHCDSWEVGQVNWTPRFMSEFRRRRGYDLFPYLPALAGKIVENREITDRFYYDFRKTVGDCIADNHYGRFRELAHRHGVLFHPESGGAHHVTPLDALKSLGRADIPMGEFWAPSNAAGDAESLRFLVRPAAMAAHAYGSNLVNAEAFTTFGPHWGQDPFQLKPVADRAFCEGANRFFFHTFTHSPAAAGKPGYEYYAGTHFNPQITWWEQAEAWTKYIARCQFMLQQGMFVADVCYYYGDQVPNTVPMKHVDPALGAGYDYDVINAEALVSRISVRDGRIVLPDGMYYRILALPDRETIDLEVLRKITELVRAGATVVGPKPCRATGLRDYPRCDQTVRELAGAVWGPCDGKMVREHPFGQGRVVCGRTLRECLLSAGVAPDFQSQSNQPDAQIDYTHRTSGNTEIYFVANRRNRWEEAVCSFRVAGKAPERWDPDTGEIHRQAVYTIVGGRTAVPLRIAPCGSLFVLFRSPADADPLRCVAANGKSVLPAAEPQAAEQPGVELLPGKGDNIELRASQPGAYVLTSSKGKQTTITIGAMPAPRAISGPWTIAFPAGWGAPKSALFPSLISWTDSPDVGVKYFSGTATYKKPFEVPSDMLADGTILLLDLGKLRNIAAVRVNGKNLGVLWKPPFRVDITAARKPAGNLLEVDVTNLWPNRLIGDEFLPSQQRFTHTNVRRFTKASPLLESGLLGPVRLLAIKTVPIPWQRGRQP